VRIRRLVRIRSIVPGTNLMPVPFSIATTVLIAFAVTFTLDLFESAKWISLHPWLSVGNIDDARAILGAIMGAVSTVLALIFSITLLVFSTAVSQFGPRLMPYFLRERTMQVALGLFLGTFLHSLLAFVVVGRRGNQEFVPQLTVLTSVGLVFFSFCYLVFYHHRIALAIQTNNVLARIVESLNSAIGEYSRPRVVDAGFLARPKPEEQANADAIRERCVTEGGAVMAITSGYLETVDHTHLVRAADRREAVVSLAYRPGQYVLEGEVLAHVFPRDCAIELASTIHSSIKIGQHRTLGQDVEFAFAQLSEIALRALSPAVNDVYTGLSSIDWLGDSLRLLAVLPASDGAWRTVGGAIRLLEPPVQFGRVVRAAFDMIRQAGARDAAVTIRLLQTCERLAAQLSDLEQQRAIREQVEAAYEGAARSSDVGIDRNAIEHAYRQACERLGAAEAANPKPALVR